MHLRRRDFLRLSAMAAAVAALGGAPPAVETRNGMPYRLLGRTGEKVSLLCVGGAHMGGRNVSEADAVRIVRTAMDEGVNFLDNAWTYTNGRCEELMGRALKDGYRERAFLMTKHYAVERTVKTAMEQLEESLRRLDVDMVDLWQIHQVQTMNDIPAVYDEGIIEAMEKAREQGKVRYIGFTGHHRPEYHLAMIERGYPWDTVQMPINPLDYHFTSFQQQVIPKAIERDIGVLAMKTLGGSPGAIPNRSGVLTAEDCLRYVMNLPVSTVVSGMDSLERLRENLAVAKSFRPLEQDEVVDILARCEQAAQDGEFETYKGREVV